MPKWHGLEPTEPLPEKWLPMVESVTQIDGGAQVALIVRHPGPEGRRSLITFTLTELLLLAKEGSRP